jgi:hypothetical protein
MLDVKRFLLPVPSMRPVQWDVLKRLTAAVEDKVGALVKRAAS